MLTYSFNNHIFHGNFIKVLSVLTAYLIFRARARAIRDGSDRIRDCRKTAELLKTGKWRTKIRYPASRVLQ